jgi:hypothetical protein
MAGTLDRIIEYDDGVKRTLVTVSVSASSLLSYLTLINPQQYNYDSSRYIAPTINRLQELFGNKKGISTVWLCDVTGHYHPLDIEDERYASTTIQGQAEDRMVYRLTLAAAIACNTEDYSEASISRADHFEEFHRALKTMAAHNSKINQH